MNPNTTDYQLFSYQIIKWYKANPRELPWRNTKDPYKIWLSEIILQQTRVAQGLPYYNAFTEAYPTVMDLALAPEEEVLRLWQGLGYYSRARNLHFCAKMIWFELGGKFPGTYKELLTLKGVGTYTAAAISSFAFGEVNAVVDGNVFRVLARFFGIDTDIASGKGKKEFEILANQLIPKEEPATFNQAMMDFGARLCVPKNPNCTDCPVQNSCFAFNKGLVKELPVKVNKTKVKERDIHYYVIKCGRHWVWNKRTAGDIWEGLHDFPQEVLKLAGQSEAIHDPIATFPKKYRHILSHQKLNVQFSELQVPEKNYQNLAEWCENEGYLLVAEEKIDQLAKPKLIVNFLNDAEI
jgi:A/G-specific adenine glycosylase